MRQDILGGDTAFYQKMLRGLELQQMESDESRLQKTLLHKLLQLSRPAEEKKSPLIEPREQYSYRKLFAHYLDETVREDAAQRSLAANDKKARMISTHAADSNASTLTEDLFYALSIKEKEKEAKSLQELRKEIPKIREMLASALPEITFDKKFIDNSQRAFEMEIAALNEQIEKYHIQKERYGLLGQKEQTARLKKEIGELRSRITTLYRKELEILFLHFSLALQKKKSSVFTLHQHMLDIAQTKLTGHSGLEEPLDRLLKFMEKSLLGTMGAIKGMGVRTVENDIDKLQILVNKPFFHINKTPISTAKLLFALLIFVLGLLLGGLFRSNIKKLSLRNGALTSSTRTLIANMGYYLIIIITFFVIMKALGIDLTSLALVAGALSVGIGFGLQNVISNFVSGIILMVERSIKIGDYIQLDENLRGHVVDIKMRSITINTNANIDIIVPNQDLIQNRVINWTMNDDIRRFEIPFSVAYGTEAQRVINVVEQAVKTSSFRDIYHTSNRYTQVIMSQMGNSSVDFKLFVWIKGAKIFCPQRTRSRFLILIYNALNKNGIEIPFPQQDLHIRSIDTEFPVVFKREK